MGLIVLKVSINSFARRRIPNFVKGEYEGQKYYSMGPRPLSLREF